MPASTHEVNPLLNEDHAPEPRRRRGVVTACTLLGLGSACAGFLTYRTSAPAQADNLQIKAEQKVVVDEDTNSTPFGEPADCKLIGVEYGGGDLGVAPKGKGSFAACGDSCKRRAECEYYVYETDNDLCHHRTSAASPTPRAGFTSGRKACGPQDDVGTTAAVFTTAASTTAAPTTTAAPSTAAPTTAAPTTTAKKEDEDCSLKGVEYRLTAHEDMGFAVDGTKNVRNCQASCQRRAGCAYFVYAPNTGFCYHRTAGARAFKDENFISGPKVCGEEAATTTQQKQEEHGTVVPPVAVVASTTAKPEAAEEDKCALPGIEYQGGDLGFVAEGGGSTTACRMSCARRVECAYFVYYIYNKGCFHRTAEARAVPSAGFVSGSKNCAADTKKLAEAYAKVADEADFDEYVNTTISYEAMCLGVEGASEQTAVAAGAKVTWVGCQSASIKSHPFWLAPGVMNYATAAGGKVGGPILVSKSPELCLELSSGTASLTATPCNENATSQKWIWHADGSVKPFSLDFYCLGWGNGADLVPCDSGPHAAVNLGKVEDPAAGAPATVSSRSLYCWAIMNKNSNEPALLGTSRGRGQNIFGCDAHDVFSAAGGTYGGIPSIAIGADTSHMCYNGAGVHYACNTEIFVKAWNKVFAMGRYKAFGWTVKADPDAAFLVGRLRDRVANFNPDEPSFFGNNPSWLVMLGPIETISRAGMFRFADRRAECMNFNLHGSGEDGWASSCWIGTLGMAMHMDHSLLSSNNQLGSCGGGQVMFHPFKDPGSLAACYGIAFR